MKFLCAFAILFVGAMAAPHKDDRFTWRPGKPIDMSKMTSMNMKVDAVKQHNNPNKLRPLTTPADYKLSPRQADSPCGIENKSGNKIVNGQEAQPNQFPWLAVVLIGGSGLCTGSLIHENWVMTAGHCVTASSYTIQLGAHDRTVAEPNKIEIDSTESYQHPQYSPIFLSGDVGLIKLPQPAPLSDVITLSCLPKRSDSETDLEGNMATITGWGKTADIGAAASKLQFARDRPIISNADCQNYYPVNVAYGTLCTDTSDRIGTCNGDSGGPLNFQTAEAGKFIQVGVTSYVSSAGCESGNPDGFSRVTFYLDWIEDTTGGDVQIED